MVHLLHKDDNGLTSSCLFPTQLSFPGSQCISATVADLSAIPQARLDELVYFWVAVCGQGTGTLQGARLGLETGDPLVSGNSMSCTYELYTRVCGARG